MIQGRIGSSPGLNPHIESIGRKRLRDHGNGLRVRIHRLTKAGVPEDDEQNREDKSFDLKRANNGRRGLSRYHEARLVEQMPMVNAIPNTTARRDPTPTVPVPSPGGSKVTGGPEVR